MNVLSLFDGISCGQIALDRVGIKVDKYFASEIKNFAIDLTQKHYPNTIQLGDVCKVCYKDGVIYSENGNFEIGAIDLLIGGSPCQNFSCANWSNPSTSEPTGFDGSKSSLFWEYKRILEEVKPKYFLLENVKMKKSDKKKMDELMGVEGIFINSNLVSFQNRERCYWTNIPNVTQPEDRHISFQDYMDEDDERKKESSPNRTPSRERMWNGGQSHSSQRRSCKNITHAEKVNCLLVKQDRCPNSGMIAYGDWVRYLTRRELELAQTLPIGYCDGLSYYQTCNVTGDGWAVDVIKHIFSFIPRESYNGAEVSE
jgi:DNA (cytosine-5)-methyltransferase 3A